MDMKAQRRANIESDHYLIIARIRERIYNARKEYRDCVKKFNCDRLKETEIKTSYVERLEERFREFIDSESANESWKVYKM
jgi:DnaJ-domain-containing protein 1